MQAPIEIGPSKAFLSRQNHREIIKSSQIKSDFIIQLIYIQGCYTC